MRKAQRIGAVRLNRVPVKVSNIALGHSIAMPQGSKPATTYFIQAHSPSQCLSSKKILYDTHTTFIPNLPSFYGLVCQPAGQGENQVFRKKELPDKLIKVGI